MLEPGGSIYRQNGMKASRIWVITSVLVLVAASCGDNSTNAPATTSPATTSPLGSDPDALVGTSWVAQRISDDSGGRGVLAGNEPTIVFGADGRGVSGSTGCNLYSGDVTIGQDAISVAQVLVTERACNPREIMEQEALFLEILTNANGFTLADGILELKSTEGSVSFIEPPPVVDAALDGTAWALDTLIDGEVAMSVLTTTTPSLTVDTGEGSMQGTTGCNGFTGTVVIEGSGFTVVEMTWTEIGCEPDIMRQETLILDVLQSAERYEIEGDHLTIFSTEGRSLVYRAG